MSGPLSSVLAEVASGTPTVGEIARRVGISDEVARAAVDHLVRTGRLETAAVPVGCPPDGCGGCASGASCGVKALLTLSVAR